jgi:hypothetical protein
MIHQIFINKNIPASHKPKASNKVKHNYYSNIVATKQKEPEIVQQPMSTRQKKLKLSNI